MEKVHHNDLTITFGNGFTKPTLLNKELRIETHLGDFNNFQFVDIFLSENLVYLIVTSCISSNIKKTFYYYVYDYGQWNWRMYSDASVKFHLNELGSNFIPYNSRYQIIFHFGASSQGKAELETLINKMEEQFLFIDERAEVRFRKWDQSKEILLNLKKTKASLEITPNMIDPIVCFLEKHNYEQEALILQGERLSFLFQDNKVSLEMDFSQRFKTKKQSKKIKS